MQIKSLERRLNKKPGLENSFAQTVTRDLDESYVVKVDKKDCFEFDCPRERYLTQHMVFHPHKLAKIRRVLIGAAKFHGYSLNNALLTGPDLLQNLIHILIRFRQYQYAVSANIDGRFLQVGVIPQDQASLRFLWREDLAEEIAVYQYVHRIFRAKDSPTCSKFALKRNATDKGATSPDATLSVTN